MNKFRAAIFDIDGVLEFRGEVCAGAIETMATLKDRGVILRFLTNSTLKSRAVCAQKLRQAGFRLSSEAVITASYATAIYLKELEPKSCWIMLDGTGLDEFKGFTQDTENPEYIVVGDNRSQFSFEYLNKAVRVLRRGAKLIGMQPELVDTSVGEVELNVGVWVQLLENASEVKAVYVGKPYPYAFELTLSTIPVHQSEVIMVGDQVSTDIKGAQNVGMKSILLKTGEFQTRDLESDVKPDFVFDSIRDVLQVF